MPSALFAEAGEGALISRVDGGAALAAASAAETGTAATRAASVATASAASMIATGTTTGSATEALAAGAITAGTITTGTIAAGTVTAGAVTRGEVATAATAAAAAASGARRATLGLDVAVVELDELLLLALALALDLAARAADELVILLLDQGLGAGPLLVNLAALVGLADRQGGVERQLLLCLLGEVVGIRHVVVLGLGLGSLGLVAFGKSLALGNGLLLLGLGERLASLLVLQLGLAFSCGRLGSLPIGTATRDGLELGQLHTRNVMSHTLGGPWTACRHAREGSESHGLLGQSS